MRKVSSVFLAGVVASIGVFSSAAAAKQVDGVTIKPLEKLMAKAGYEPSTGVSENGFEYIDFASNGVNSRMYINNCEQDRACGVITISSGFDLEEGTTLAAMNDWSSTKLFLQAYLDDEMDPFIEMHINLKFGVNEKNFLDTLEWWVAIQAEFIDYIGFE